MSCFNFATLRQLSLGDRWVKEMLLPVFPAELAGSGWAEKGMDVISGQEFVFARKKEAVFGNQIQEEDGKSFKIVVFFPLCNKPAS